MSEMQRIKVENLKLDLKNYRTPKQTSEKKAISALIAINEDWFWGLTESLIEDGYLDNELIILLRDPKNPKNLIVKEGNRRIAAMKLLLGKVTTSGLPIRDDILERMKTITNEWRKVNATVPCSIYTDPDFVDKIVTRIHGKANHTGRYTWSAVAKARHNRDVENANEPALDLLESYLKNGKNIQDDQRERWGGDYPLTILSDALPKCVSHFKAETASELSKMYPDGLTQKSRKILESLLLDIGMKMVGFEALRKEDILFKKYGIGTPTETSTNQSGTDGSHASKQSGSSQAAGSSSSSASSTTQKSSNSKKPSHPVGTEANAKQLIKNLLVTGNRGKIKSLQVECLKMKLSKTPHAFCFVLRCMFELSAKAYCDEHKGEPGVPTAVTSDGNDKSLVRLLGDITKNMEKTWTKAEFRKIHGAITELGKDASLLSCTSLNQLMHNPNFSVTEQDICTNLSKIFPLLQALND